MSAERTPEDRTSGLTGGPRPEDAGEQPPAHLRAPGLQALAGLTVRGSDDRVVGRVRDVYQYDASGELAALTVMPRQLSSRTVMIPAAAIGGLTPPGASPAPDKDAVVRLRVDAVTARAGRRPPATAHVGPEELREAAEALGLGREDAAGTGAADGSVHWSGTADAAGPDDRPDPDRGHHLESSAPEDEPR